VIPSAATSKRAAPWMASDPHPQPIEQPSSRPLGQTEFAADQLMRPGAVLAYHNAHHAMASSPGKALDGSCPVRHGAVANQGPGHPGGRDADAAGYPEDQPVAVQGGLATGARPGGLDGRGNGAPEWSPRPTLPPEM
jgi:hypothetical protein